MTESPLVVVGASCAGTNLALAAREFGSQRRIIVVGEESGFPYHRPPLSKAYLSGKADDQSLMLRPEKLYASQGIKFLPETRVISIDRNAKALLTSEGQQIPYGQLALTTGCRPRRLSLAGAEADNVLLLRTIAEARSLREAAQSARSALVIGGGFIGLEVAATLAQKGIAVTVLELEPRLLQRAVSTLVADALLKVHRSHDVTFRFGVTAAALELSGNRVRSVRLSDNSTVGCDLVIVGIGTIPNDELARDAGLSCDNGILIDAHGRTSDESIVAAGDCARQSNVFADGQLLRLESVQNATDQARSAAATLTARADTSVKAPWFWSDQYDVKLQIAGIITGADTSVVRGTPEEGKFSVFHFRNGSFIGAESFSRASDHVLARRCLGESISLSPSVVGDTSIDLATIIRQSKQ